VVQRLSTTRVLADGSRGDGVAPVKLPAHAGAMSAVFRRLRPSDPEWPSADKWEQLNRELGGHLISVPPLLGACTDTPESAGCQALMANLQNPYYIGDQPAGTQTSGWVDAWTPAPSVYAVPATTPEHVVAAVNFARENHLRLVVKGGGHSYQGTSNASDSLLVWTRPMDSVVLHDAFVAQGCAEVQDPQPAVTVEAGALWMHGYDSAWLPQSLLQLRQQQSLTDALFAATRHWSVALHSTRASRCKRRGCAGGARHGPTSGRSQRLRAGDRRWRRPGRVPGHAWRRAGYNSRA
jgi:FAD binding domain